MSGYLDYLADTLVSDQPGEQRTVGTFAFIAAVAMDFCLQPETWPVFVEWYSERAANVNGLATRGQDEMRDALGVAALLMVSGTRL